MIRDLDANPIELHCDRIFKIKPCRSFLDSLLYEAFRQNNLAPPLLFFFFFATRVNSSHTITSSTFLLLPLWPLLLPTAPLEVRRTKVAIFLLVSLSRNRVTRDSSGCSLLFQVRSLVLILLSVDKAL